MKGIQIKNKIMDLNQVTLPSSDIETSIEFYKKLGLLLIVLVPSVYARFECPTGNSTFSLHQASQDIKQYEHWTYFECKDLDEKVEELVSQGIKFDLPSTDQAWKWREARLADPDGNKLILFSAGENRKNPPWRLDK